MRIGQPHPVQYALYAAILAKTAMQGVEHDIGFLCVQGGYQRCQIGACIQCGDLIDPKAGQRFGHTLPGGQTDSRSEDRPPMRTVIRRGVVIVAEPLSCRGA